MRRCRFRSPPGARPVPSAYGEPPRPATARRATEPAPPGKACPAWGVRARGFRRGDPGDRLWRSAVTVSVRAIEPHYRTEWPSTPPTYPRVATLRVTRETPGGRTRPVPSTLPVCPRVPRVCGTACPESLSLRVPACQYAVPVRSTSALPRRRFRPRNTQRRVLSSHGYSLQSSKPSHEVDGSGR